MAPAGRPHKGRPAGLAACTRYSARQNRPREGHHPVRGRAPSRLTASVRPPTYGQDLIQDRSAQKRADRSSSSPSSLPRPSVYRGNRKGKRLRPGLKPHLSTYKRSAFLLGACSLLGCTLSQSPSRRPQQGIGAVGRQTLWASSLAWRPVQEPLHLLGRSWDSDRVSSLQRLEEHHANLRARPSAIYLDTSTLQVDIGSRLRRQY